MQDGFYRVINDIISIPLLDIQLYTLLLSADISLLTKTKQVILIELSDKLVLSFCSKIQKEYFYKDLSEYDLEFFDKTFIEKMNNNLPYLMFDLILYFGTLNLFKISFLFLYMYKKYNLKKCNCTVYALEKCTNIPLILKSGKIVKEFPKFNIIKNETINYSKFKNTNYYTLNSCQTGFEYDINLLFSNIPYLYYSKAIYLSDAICCYDLNNKNYWFANSSKSRFISLINDIKLNGIKLPLALKINEKGQYISSEDCNLRALIALYLKLPYIPVITYFSPEITPELKLIPKTNLISLANKIYNPYFIFN